MRDDSVTAVRLTIYEFRELHECEQALEAVIRSHLKSLGRDCVLECIRRRWEATVKELNQKFKEDPVEPPPMPTRARNDMS